ncbi:hypothetical protein VKT23_008657 [Stygiomarasmius scandens]|uniref:Uncharacterized protein n=1 Tax=Marasmiellus scandens TaxID=2682957 RepID=A0ABR1JHW0_9AGAR
MRPMIVLFTVLWFTRFLVLAQTNPGGRQTSFCSENTGTIFQLTNFTGTINETDVRDSEVAFGMAFDVLNPFDPLQAFIIAGMFIIPSTYGYAGVCFGEFGDEPLCLIGWAFLPGQCPGCSNDSDFQFQAISAWVIGEIGSEGGVFIPAPFRPHTSHTFFLNNGKSVFMTFICTDCFTWFDLVGGSFDLKSPVLQTSFGVFSDSVQPGSTNESIPFKIADFKPMFPDVVKMNRTAGTDCRTTPSSDDDDIPASGPVQNKFGQW